MEKQNWENVLKESNVDIAYDNFISTIKSIYNEECPKSKVKVNVKHVNKPWFTSGLKNACLKKKNKLYRLFIKTKSENVGLKYKRYKNKLTSILRAAENIILVVNFNSAKIILKQHGMY